MSEQRPLKVFLCHAHADRDSVRGVYARLSKDGVDAWLDKEKLLPGQDWELEIRKAVHEADVVIVCLSKQFNQAGFRQKEVRIALDTAMEKPEGEIFIIPARLEECENLESLRKWHWVDLFEDDGHEMLMRALRARANKIGATLQVKRGWLPKVNTQPVDAKTKRPSAPNKKPVEVKQEKPVKDKEGEQFSPTRRFNFRKTGIAGIILFALLFGGWGINYLINQSPTTVPTPSLTATDVNPMAILEKYATGTAHVKTLTASAPTVSSTPTVTPKLSTPTPTLGIGSTKTSEKDGMTLVYIPAGQFNMGSDLGNEDEKPVHTVYLDSYWMDQTEVTNKMYALCVDAGSCEPPTSVRSATNSIYYGNSKFNDYPVIYVSWLHAQTYCNWADRRLPTEAEWEKAARGQDGRTYPWGEGSSCDQANYNTSCIGDTAKAGSYLTGRSPYGLFDLAGNVWEWAMDWYDSDQYANSISRNPEGPATGMSRVFRGGSWKDDNDYLRSTLRGRGTASYSDNGLGFRCVVSDE